MVGLTLGLLRSLYIKEREQISRNEGKEMEVMVTIKQQQGGKFNLQIGWCSSVWGVFLDKKNIATEIPREYVQRGTKMIILHSF